MNAPKYSKRVFMKFEASVKREPSPIIRKNRRTTRLRNNLTKREIVNLLFDNCDGCLRMASIPQGAFAARKVRENDERRFLVIKMEKRGGSDNGSKRDTGYSKKNSKEEGRELTPLKYNSKLMNSIWGLYNRYSVHNFKKNTDADDAIVAAECWGPMTNRNRSPASPKVMQTLTATIGQLLGPAM